MKKRFLVLVSIFLIFPTMTSCKQKKIEIIKDDVIIDYIDSLISDTKSYVPAWNKESFKGRWNYIDGVFLNSIVNLSEAIKDTNKEKSDYYKNFFLQYINFYINSNGRFINPVTQEENYNATELDSVCESKVLFDAYNYTSDLRYRNAIEFTYQNLIKMDIVENSYGNFNHKASYPNQVWLDGMYMYAPFYARYAKEYNINSIFTRIKEQYRFIKEHMYDQKMNLYYHGYSSTGIFWSDHIPGCSKSFWLRSMGWYMVSLADVIEYFPNGNDKEYLISLLAEALQGVLKYQDANTSMFYQVVDKKDIAVNISATYFEGLKNNEYLVNGAYKDAIVKNYLESSGSSMIAYALMKAAKNGYIESKFFDIGVAILEGVYMHSFDETNKTLKDICITAGLGPESKLYRDGTIEYYLAEPIGANDAKGVGPFIMACIMYKFS